MKVEVFIDGYYEYGMDWYYQKDFSISLDIDFLPRKGEILYLSRSIYDKFNNKFNSLSESEKRELVHNKTGFHAEDFIYIYNIYHDFSKNKKTPRIGLVPNAIEDINIK